MEQGGHKCKKQHVDDITMSELEKFQIVTK